ncbi:hypothetical protein BFW38_03565 [Terasakiispira papahanaumokuakeensis]|uniref:PA-phosphatase n=1 Tax=Terasakiispira papahanaumokuakeensis TaxID=197479 RepID=A0A1E2V6W5_9GAMM|nr:DUF1315 family protein [Terasakiispira papahanaumokuakeensis]ODC02758.1 hypothetical protein BFW38_03565 [Terasakiispira papahanaumokuakeensis]
MNFEKMIDNMSPEIYQALKRGIELGKWPDGRPLSSEQRELCMEAVIRFEVQNNVPEQQRVGYIDMSRCDSHDGDSNLDDQPIKWMN